MPVHCQLENVMNVSNRNIVERVARVLAGQRFSANADGDQSSAATTVESEWPHFVDDAVAVLKTMREPDAQMAEAGDVAIWERMIRAALPEGELV
jgi:hypothetical protein